MILDAQALFDDNQQHLTTEASNNLLDLGEARNLGVGEDLYLVAVVKTAMVGASALALTLETDDDSAFGSATTRQTIGSFPAASAVGTRLVAKLAPDVINERYLRGKWTKDSTDNSAGKFTVGITKDIQAFTAYADGLTIS